MEWGMELPARWAIRARRTWASASGGPGRFQLSNALLNIHWSWCGDPASVRAPKKSRPKTQKAERLDLRQDSKTRHCPQKSPNDLAKIPSTGLKENLAGYDSTPT